jgi:hypothetical protein
LRVVRNMNFASKCGIVVSVALATNTQQSLANALTLKPSKVYNPMTHRPDNIWDPFMGTKALLNRQLAADALRLFALRPVNRYARNGAPVSLMNAALFGTAGRPIEIDGSTPDEYPANYFKFEDTVSN